MQYLSFTLKGLWLFLFLIAIQISAQVTRQPYLQMLTPTSIEVRWNTDSSGTGKVHYGLSTEALSSTVVESASRTFHQVGLSGLSPDTKYYYSIDTLAGSEEQYFTTSPNVGDKGQKKRIWVISDFGQSRISDNTARKFTMLRWKNFNNDSYHSDLVLSLGDQTENDTQDELQKTYFDLLEGVLLNSPLFTIQGNHDNYDGFVNYRKTFTLPANGESGGYPSNNQDYYSFDFGNIHVVGLSTEIDDIDGTQLTWLKNDLQNIDQEKTDWLIACLHRPFHSGGYHPTDASGTAQKQRTYWLKELEDYGVDVILQGHNAIYERSYLIDNLIGKTTDLTVENIIDDGNGREDGDGAYYKGSGLSPHHGTIFIEVAPGGNSVKNNANYPIFAYAFSGSSIEGSVVIDVDGASRMDVHFLCNTPDADVNYVWDYFTIIKTDSISTGTRTLKDVSDNHNIRNYPNPFRQSTQISYDLGRADFVRVDIYDMMGRAVYSSDVGLKEKGMHTIEWSARDENGDKLPEGMYIAQIQGSRIVRKTRMMLLQ
ncbi:metallophosphoesterase [Bacteroidota bacterium]